MQAIGKFTVNLEPLEFSAQGENGIQLARMSIDKSFEGDLEGSSKGEMLSTMTTVNGSAGYVAVEQVNANLSGKSGTFVLQHYGIMAQGQDRLVLEVVPDSASDDLTGLTGKMSIQIEDGAHNYQFDYEL